MLKIRNSIPVVASIVAGATGMSGFNALSIDDNAAAGNASQQIEDLESANSILADKVTQLQSRSQVRFEAPEHRIDESLSELLTLPATTKNEDLAKTHIALRTDLAQCLADNKKAGLLLRSFQSKTATQRYTERLEQ